MPFIFRQNVPFIAAVSAGLFLGVGGTVLYFRLANKLLSELQRLSITIRELKAEVLDLKQKLNTDKQRVHRSAVYYSAQGSSVDDDDDVYEEAYGGSDIESLKDVATDFHRLSRVPAQRIKSKDEGLFHHVDRLFDGTDDQKEEAFDLLSNNKAKYSTDAEYHWRLGKASYMLGQIEGARGNAVRRKELLYESKDLSDTAVALNNSSANAHKWYAITLGSIGEFEGMQDKIKNGYIFKDHIKRAIELNPTDPSNHHLLGRWCYGVYMLTWLERKAAAALFATPPTSTAEEALANFIEADRLNPGKWKENLLYAGKCYLELGNATEAVKWLQRANVLPSVSQDDKTAQAEIEILLAKYG
ncbi:hypothetical protein ScPMuIL_013746 [Solemya velum]